MAFISKERFGPQPMELGEGPVNKWMWMQVYWWLQWGQSPGCVLKGLEVQSGARVCCCCSTCCCRENPPLENSASSNFSVIRSSRQTLKWQKWLSRNSLSSPRTAKRLCWLGCLLQKSKSAREKERKIEALAVTFFFGKSWNMLQGMFPRRPHCHFSPLQFAIYLPLHG